MPTSASNYVIVVYLTVYCRPLGQDVTCEPRSGLVCVNSQQGNGACADYRVRFLCPCGSVNYNYVASCSYRCWTNWLDRDNPSGNGDFETIADFSASQTCPSPIGADCRVKSTLADWTTTGQTYVCNARHGGICWNNRNPGSYCLDYEARFLCEC